MQYNITLAWQSGLTASFNHKMIPRIYYTRSHKSRFICTLQCLLIMTKEGNSPSTRVIYIPCLTICIKHK